MDLYPGALLAAVLLAGHGLRKGSLAPSGAAAALAVGYASLATPLRSCGVTLLAFYFVGSRATKIGHGIKATLETESAGPQPQSRGTKATDASSQQRHAHHASSGGRRDAGQVLCNSLLGATCALLFRILYGGAGISKSSQSLIESLPQSVALLLRPEPLFFLMLGHYACCMGDTLASELGILAKGSPRLIVPPFRKVPRGTNGGMSLQGTIGSLVGGLLVGAVAGLAYVLLDNPAEMRNASVVFASSRIARGTQPWLDTLLKGIVGVSANSTPALQAPRFIAICAVLGAFGGLAGSALDSLLGATLQRTWYSRRRGQVLIGSLPKGVKADAKHASTRETDDWAVVTGHDILSNSAVNLVSSFVTAVTVAAVGSHILSQI